jgi:RNA polymerase-associated protein LEO1
MSDNEDKSVKDNDDGGEDKTKKNVSNRDLFGDSSDDDDDDDDMMVDSTKKDTKSSDEKATAAKKDAKKDATADVEDAFGDSDEDEEESETKTPAVVSTKPPRRSIHDASSDEEDDVEFDDNGAVVGLSSSTVAGVKLASNNNKKAEDEDKDDDDEDDDATKKLAVTKHKPVHLTVPAVSAPPPKDPKNDNKTELYFTRLPNMLGIQPEAFDLDTYSAAVEHGDYAVHDMVRWRYRKDEAGRLVRTVTVDNTDGKLQRDSNTRLVEWEDGSWTLHIGKEAFEVDAVNSGGNDFAGLNGYLYLSQTATKKSMPEDGDDDDDDAVEEPAGTVLECMGPIVSRLVARPSLSSEAHKSLTVAIRQRTIKKARIAEYVTELDPEKSKQERIQVKEELEKAAARKRQGYSGGYGGGGAGGGGGGGRAAGGRSRKSYLEDDEDFDTTNIKAMKRGEYEEMDDYGDESESEEERTFHKARPTAAAARAKQKDESSSDGDDDVLMDDDDDEDEVAPVAKTNKKRSSQAVIDDDDSDSD